MLVIGEQTAVNWWTVELLRQSGSGLDITAVRTLPTLSNIA